MPRAWVVSKSNDAARTKRRILAAGVVAAMLGMASAAHAQSATDPRAEPSTPPPYPPKLIPYAESGFVPPGYHVETRTTHSYVFAGATLFGAAYLTSVIVAGTVEAGRQPDAPHVVPLAIPIVGPFITCATADGGVGAGAMLALDGIAQIGGAALLIAGLEIPEKVVVINTIGVRAHFEVGPTGGFVRGTF